MLERLSEHIRTHALCTPQDHILVAVSGGVDSMTLLHLLKISGYSVGVAHVNFQLRGADADADEAFVREWCQGAAISFHGCRTNTKDYAGLHGLSIQMAARELRYDFFQRVAAEHGYTVIATAHHSDDVAEQVLMSLAKGRGPEALLGIPVRNGNIIRPLLFASRIDIASWASHHGVPYRDDASNATDDYERNQLRHQVMPALQTLYPALNHGFTRSAFKASGDQQLVRDGVTLFHQRYAEVNGDDICISKEFLNHYPQPAAVLWRFLQPYGFNTAQIEDIVATAQTGKKVYSASHQLVCDRNDFIVAPIAVRLMPTVVQATGTTTRGSEQLELEYGTFGFTADATLAVLDSDKLKFPLTWRGWQPGDQFCPLGMTQHKKISDFLIDVKAPAPLKERTSVLCSGDDIVWVVGMRIDDRYKVTPNTKQMVRFRWAASAASLSAPA